VDGFEINWQQRRWPLAVMRMVGRIDGPDDIGNDNGPS
jgi:hypothetical protein